MVLTCKFCQLYSECIFTLKDCYGFEIFKIGSLTDENGQKAIGLSYGHVHVLARKAIQDIMNTYPMCDSPLNRSARYSLSPLRREIALKSPLLSGAPNDSFLQNTLKTLFQAVQSTFRLLEMHFKRRCKVWICSVILGHVESFRILQELQYYFPENFIQKKFYQTSFENRT